MRERKRARRPARRPYESSPHATQLTTDLLLLPHPSLWPRDRESGRGVAPDSGHHCPEAWAACRSGKPCVWYRLIRMQESHRNRQRQPALETRLATGLPGPPVLRGENAYSCVFYRVFRDAPAGVLLVPLLDRYAAPTDTSQVVVTDDSGTSFEPSGGLSQGFVSTACETGRGQGVRTPRGVFPLGFPKSPGSRGRGIVSDAVVTTASFSRIFHGRPRKVRLRIRAVTPTSVRKQPG